MLHWIKCLDESEKMVLINLDRATSIDAPPFADGKAVIWFSESDRNAYLKTRVTVEELENLIKGMMKNEQGVRTMR